MIPQVLHGHSKGLSQVKFNADGDLLFTVARDRVPMVWNTKTNMRIGAFDVNGHTGAVWGCDVNRSSTLLATAGADQNCKLWHVYTGECVGTIEHETPVKCVNFNHDDTIVFTITDNKFSQTPAINMYNLPDQLFDPNGGPVKTKFNPTAQITNPEVIKYAVWGPTNASIFGATEDGYVVQWDVERLKEVRAGQVHTSANPEINRVRFDAKYNMLLTASKDCTAKLVDSRNLQVIRTFKTEHPVNDAVFNPVTDHVMVAGGTEATNVTTTSAKAGSFDIHFFHKVFGEKLGSLAKSHFSTINALDVHPSGKMFASGAEEGMTKIHTFDEAFWTMPGSQPLFEAM